jgi:hypothetical protein
VDFQLYARVLWRFRLVVAAGLVLAIGAAALSMVKVGSDGFSYREPELWSSKARLGVTQYGFPWGRLFAQTVNPESEPGKEGSNQIPVANPDRFNALAVLYAELAASDPVRAIMREEGAVRGEVVAAALRHPESGVLLPLIDLTGLAPSPREAIATAGAGVSALQSYLEEEQRTNGVPPSDRVVLEVLVQPTTAEVFQPRSKTMPAVIFFAVLVATIGLVFLLENLRPRYLEVEEPESPPIASAAHRRTA